MNFSKYVLVTWIVALIAFGVVMVVDALIWRWRLRKDDLDSRLKKQEKQL